MLKLVVRRGKLGRWRYFLLKDGKHRAMCGVWGYGSLEDARSAAVRDFSESVEIDGEYGPMYAGGRDFSD